MNYKENQLAIVREDFRVLDGVYYFYPKRVSCGGYSAELLRWIAEELDKLNNKTGE